MYNFTMPLFAILPKSEKHQLHVFADASEIAYAACVWLRSEDASGNVNFSLLFARTKVAPVTTLSLPRLELSAVHL